MNQSPRAHPRYALAVNCVIAGGDEEVRGKTSNLSRGGVALSVPASIAISTMVQVEMALDFGHQRSSEPLSLSAVVVWCTRLDDGFQLGAKFNALTREQRAYLDLFLHFLDERPDDSDSGSDGGSEGGSGAGRGR